MADLSTLDATQPPDTQLVAQGAQRIRETRDATKTSFGTEHSLTGEHAIPTGITAARPAAGHAGRLYVNTENKRLERDTGSSWTKVQNNANGSNTLGGTVLTTSYQDISGGGRQISSGGFITCLTIVTVEHASSGLSGTISFRFVVNGVPQVPEWHATTIGNAEVILNTMHLLLTPIAGVSTITIEGKSSSGTASIINNCALTLIEL